MDLRKFRGPFAFTAFTSVMLALFLLASVAVCFTVGVLPAIGHPAPLWVRLACVLVVPACLFVGAVVLPRIGDWGRLD